MRVPEAIPRTPDAGACLLGARVSPETMIGLSNALVHAVAVKCTRVVHHTISYADPDIVTIAPSGSATEYVRWTLGPIAGPIVVSYRYQASRPKDGSNRPRK